VEIYRCTKRSIQLCYIEFLNSNENVLQKLGVLLTCIDGCRMRQNAYPLKYDSVSYVMLCYAMVINYNKRRMSVTLLDKVK
jgi:hypothetical protein